MTQNFYSSAIYLTVPYFIVTFLRGIIDFQLGGQVIELQSFSGWITFEFLISLIWWLVLLKYYHYKQYKFAFLVLIIFIPVSFYHLISAHDLLNTREYTDNYTFAFLTLLGTSILYGISLIFSKAGKRPWLKAAGILSLALGLTMLFSAIWAISSITAIHNGTITKIGQWVSLIGSLSPVLFIMNFVSEKSAAEKVITTPQKSWGVAIDIVAVLALISALFFGSKLTVESIGLRRNPDQVSELLEETAKPFEARTYTNSHGKVLPYRLLKPLGYDPIRKYPLVVCLHGSSGRGADNVKQVTASLMAQMLSDHKNRTKYPAFLFVPQCPRESDWGGVTNIPSVDSLVFETILALEKEFLIDTGRRYIAGISMGGYGTWHLICTRPEMFAAAIPIAGGGDPSLAQNVVDIPIWAFHGAKDRNVLVRGSRDMINAIRNEGGEPRYTEFPDKAHHISEDIKGTPGLLDWLFAQKRN